MELTNPLLSDEVYEYALNHDVCAWLQYLRLLSHRVKSSPSLQRVKVRRERERACVTITKLDQRVFFIAKFTIKISLPSYRSILSCVQVFLLSHSQQLVDVSQRFSLAMKTSISYNYRLLEQDALYMNHDPHNKVQRIVNCVI